MRTFQRLIAKVADTDAAVLLRGETGVGKGVTARAIHAASARRHGPFVKVNCAAVPADLLESELFGHEKGAFTGAYRQKLGKFELASQGTILLDEIGELPLALQAKILHVLDDLTFSRIGGGQMLRIDTRVVASTNRDLEAAVQRREFREDLYFRLNVIEIVIPPLRERKEEIPVLAAAFVARFNEQYGRRVELPAEMVGRLVHYSWPGNVRELENLVRRLVVLGHLPQIVEIVEKLHTVFSGNTAPALPQSLRGEPQAFSGNGDAAGGLKDLARQAARDAERRALAEVLERVHWNRTEAARILKISYKTLLSKIAECGPLP